MINVLFRVVGGGILLLLSFMLLDGVIVQPVIEAGMVVGCSGLTPVIVFVYIASAAGAAAHSAAADGAAASERSI